MKDVYLLSSNITHLLTFIKAGQGASYSQGFQMPDRNENTEVMENIRRLATSLKTSPAVINNIDNAYLSDLKNIFNKVIEESDDNGKVRMSVPIYCWRVKGQRESKGIRASFP